MKFYWSTAKCGQTALVITWFDLINLIERECFDFSKEHPDWLRNWDKKPEFKNPMNFGILAHRIVSKVEKAKLTCPFEGMEEKLEKAFLREKS